MAGNKLCFCTTCLQFSLYDINFIDFKPNYATDDKDASFILLPLHNTFLYLNLEHNTLVDLICITH